MKITKIIIVTGVGPDTVHMTTTLPNACHPYTGFQEMKMDVASGNGENYVKEYFPGVPYEIISNRHVPLKFKTTDEYF
jgi:hypothetical protein